MGKLKVSLTIGKFVYKMLKVINRRQKDPGHPYKDILAMVKKEYPESNTKIGNIHWYATQLRNEGIELPSRPLQPKKQREGVRHGILEYK